MSYFVVEKKVQIFEKEVLDAIIRKGAEISGSCDLVHAHVWIPEGKEDAVLKILKKEGFYTTESYKKDRTHHKKK